MKKKYQILWYDENEKKVKIVKKSKFYETYEKAEDETKTKHKNLTFNIQCSFSS